MQKLQRQMNIDRRWDSIIDRLEIKYGLRLDDWKRLGRDQMGQKCGRGWQGLRGACKRVPKGGDKEAAIKASKVALADRIRKNKGLRDRNAPKVKNEPQIDTSQPLNKTELKSIYFRLADGEISANELKAHWQRMKLPATKEALRAELGKQTIAELQREFPSYQKQKKGAMVEGGIDALERLFIPDGESTSFIFGSKAEMDASKLASMERAVSKWTDQKIKDQAASAIARKAERKKALTNPETLDEFRSFDLVRGADKLTPEQRRKYEDLQAGANLSRRVKQEEFKATAAPVSVKKEGEVFGEIQQTKHTKTGQDLHVVPMGAGDRLSKEDFYKLKDRAKTFGGSYSSYRGVGAIPGFQFKTPEDAAKFRTLDKENRGPEAAIAGQAKKQSKLHDLADRIEERANETLGIDRQVNTERRARMAGNVEAAANETRRKAETIRNLADADARGELKFLGKVSSGADIDQLNKILDQGHYAYARDLNKENPRLRMEELFDKPRNLESIDRTKMPSMELQPREVRNLAKVGAQIPGMKLLSNRYTKAAAEADARSEKMQSYAGVKLRSPQDIAEFKAYVKKLESSAERNPRLKRDLSYDIAGVRDVLQNNDRLTNMGITDNASLRAALREYLPHTGKKKEETATQSAYRRERELIGGDKSIGVDFFPTPKILAERVASQAEIREGMSVLDPSAGGGRLSDAAKEAGGKVKAIEMSSSLQAILKGKGHDVDGGDFLDVVPTASYDRVVMNPPFSGGADMEHVQHAYKFLKPGGKMVAIMSEGPFFRGDKKATQFRSWLDANEGESEKLPENSFKESNTGVNTRLVTISKPGKSMDNRKDSLESLRYSRAIVSLNEKYGWSLRLDDWKRLGRDQMGQKCGRGWVGLRGACERGKKADDNTEKIKKSKVALADKIRARKGLRDRNAPKALPPKIEIPTLKKAADLKEGDRIRFGAGFKGIPEGDYHVTGTPSMFGSDHIVVKKLSVTGNLIGKEKTLLARTMDLYSTNGINLNPGPIEERAKKGKFIPAEDMNKGRLGPSISPSNVVATDKRFTSAAINNALDQIKSEGASERMSSIRSIIETQGIQAVFKGASSSGGNQKLVDGIENKGDYYKKRLEFIARLEEARRPSEVIAKVRQDTDMSLVGGKAKSLGYTFKTSRHVVILTGKRGAYPSFNVTPEEMQSAADRTINPPNGNLPFSTSGTTKGAASDLITYLHEVGHQVHWISESKDPSLATKAPRRKPVTKYGSTNDKEFFAEGFALWTLDAKGLKAKNPEMHDYIAESVTAAMGAKRRMDSIINGLGMNPIAPVQPSDIAQTPLGQQAFTIVLSGDSSWNAYKSLDSYAAAAKVGTEQDETMAAIEAFIVAGGEFTEPINDSPRFDAAEITRYARAIAVLNDRYGWHLDAQKVLSKLGKKLGKKCGGGWISPEKKCKSHYTNGKLNESGKASGENLADRIRQRKKLSTVSRNGKGQELAYAFLPGNQKQSTMAARRTHAPKNGYETPGRLAKTSSTEERRSIVGLGQFPGRKVAPDSAPIMDLPTKRSSTPTKGAAYLTDPKTNEAMKNHEGVKKIAEAIDSHNGIVDTGSHSTGATGGTSETGSIRMGIVRVKKLNPPSKGNKKGSVTVEKDDGSGGKQVMNVPLSNFAEGVKQTDRAKNGLAEIEGSRRFQGLDFKPRQSAPTPIESQTRKLNATVPRSTAGDRIRAVAKALEDESKIQKGATVGILKSAEKLYVNQNKMIKEVAGMVNEDLDRAAAKGVRKMFDPAQTPVRIPNQRSSSEPRKRGRSVD